MYRTKRLLLLVVCTLMTSAVMTGQATEVELARIPGDTAKVSYILAQADLVVETSTDSALQMLYDILPVAKQTGSPMHEAQVWNHIGQIYSDGKQSHKSIASFDSLRILAEKFHLTDQLADAHYGMGNHKNAINHKREAIEHLIASFELSLSIGDVDRQFRARYHHGLVHSYLGEYELADEVLLSSYTLVSDPYDTLKMTRALQGLGNNAARSSDLEKALGYYRHGIDLLGDRYPTRAITLYRNMGYSCYVMGAFPLSMEFYQQVLFFSLLNYIMLFQQLQYNQNLFHCFFSDENLFVYMC